MRICKRFALILLSSLFFFSCREQTENRIVIWTNSSEFAQYTELYNKSHKTTQAILVYKENPANAIPPTKEELVPDIIVGSWLRTDEATKNFKSLDYLFDRKNLTDSIFYPQLIEAGKYHKSHYLLPLSFNLPVVLFSTDNEKLITDDYTLSLDDIRKISSSFNEKKRNGTYSKIGFVPTGNEDFLYLATKVHGANFSGDNKKIIYNEDNLNFAIENLKDWINTENTSVRDEMDFSYKYLFMPDYRQVTSERTLFSYATSDRLFDILRDQDLNIDYRWIANDNTILLEDSFVMLGIYKKSKNQPGATEFISWLFNSETQKNIIERKIDLDLNTEMFGISGGFSAVKEVTEKILPSFYTQLLTNIPPASMLQVPQKLPPRWESYKSIVLMPYIINSLSADDDSKNTVSISELEKEWRKKLFD